MKSSNMIEGAVGSALGGKNVFYVSDSDDACERHIAVAQAHAVKLGARLVRNEGSRLLRAGTGTLQFYVLRQVEGRYVRPSLSPRENDDKHFHVATVGMFEPRLIVDHYAEYLLDRDRRRAMQAGAEQ